MFTCQEFTHLNNLRVENFWIYSTKKTKAYNSQKKRVRAKMARSRYFVETVVPNWVCAIKTYLVSYTERLGMYLSISNHGLRSLGLASINRD